MRKKNVFKILSVLLTLIVFTVCIQFAVSASGAKISVNQETAYRGETVTFHATLSQSIEVGSGSLALSYDPNVLELTGGSCDIGETLISFFDVAKGKSTFAFVGAKAISGKLFTATFKVKDDAPFGESAVSLTVTLKDGFNATVPLTNLDGSVTVKCNHSFTKEDTTYLKSEAQCTSPALYYKSCVTCGEKGTETFAYGTAAPHTFTKKVTTDTYKKSSASCVAKAQYYFCCETCDARGTEAYESGSLLDHDFSRKDISDLTKVSDADCDSKAQYHYRCMTCDAVGSDIFEHGEVLGHTGGSATCTEKAECDRCHRPYGKTLDHVYTDTDATDAYLKTPASCTKKAVYYKNCATCDKAGTATFESGEKKAHVYAAREANVYLKTPATCTEKAIYYKSCSTCGARGTETFTGSALPTHSYETAWSADASAHWHACSKCQDKKDVTAHTAGAAPTEWSSQNCTVCNYVMAPALEHTHRYDSQWTSDADAHWYACSGCNEVKDKTAHVYTNACDTDCNTCGHTRTVIHSYKTEWSSNGEQHWHECSVCQDKADAQPHIPGAPATETTDQTCTACGHVLQSALGHTHQYNSMKQDATNHWKECVCGEKTEITAHSGGAATCDKKAKCAVCNAEYGELAAHKYSEATCTAKAKCSACGNETGELAEHNYSEATCTAKAKCSACGNETGELAEHNYSEATCTAKAKCSACNQETGELAAHKYSEATCTVKAKCSVCGDENGELADHQDKTGDGKCDACGAQMAVDPPLPPDENDGLSTGTIIGIVVGAVAVVGIGASSAVWFGLKKKK